MQASSVFFNTKLILAPIYAGNRYGKDNRNFTSNTIQLNRAQLKQPVTWRHMSRRRCSRAYLVNSKHNVWLDDAFDRAKQLYLYYYRSIPKSLERSTARKLMLSMLNGDERFVEPTPNSLQLLTLAKVKDAVMNQFVCDNMEVSIVGDFSEEDIES